MSNPDRNVRALMLRLLAHQPGGAAKDGVVLGLRDDSRRVRQVAIQACPRFMAYADIVAALAEMAHDNSCKRKLRRRALSMLAGDEGRWRGDITPAVANALGSLMRAPEYRFPILFGLVRLDLARRVEDLLRQFAEAGGADESAMAWRALHGERVIHLDRYADDDAMRRRIMAKRDLAYGRMYYWLPRECSE